MDTMKHRSFTYANPNSSGGESGTLAGSSFYSNSFVPGGTVTISLALDVYSEYGDWVTMCIKSQDGTVLLSIFADLWNPVASASIDLAPDTYTFEVNAVDVNNIVGTNYSVSWPATETYYQTHYRFVYHKYDELNRITSTGEYETINSDDFTQANANNRSFPADNPRLSNQFLYDEPANEPMFEAQRNLKGRLSRATSYDQSSPVWTSYYSYDEFGRVEWIGHKSPSAQKWRVSYWYDLQGNILKKTFEDLLTGIKLSTFYEYDGAQRLSKVYDLGTTMGMCLDVQYSYFPSGKVKRQVLGSAQGVDFRYNSRDWLTQINHQNLGSVYQGVPQDPGRDGYDSGLPADRFGMIIGYDVPGHIGDPAFQNATPQFNGNISWLMYNMDGVNFSGSAGTTPLVGWTYAYNAANRLTKADFGQTCPKYWVSHK